MMERDSNIELLRLVCMFLIVFQHCIHGGAFPEIWNTDIMSIEVCVASLLVGLTYIAVNCFVLISGFYGIKLKLRSALNLYLICAFYALIIYLLHLYIDGAHVGRGLLYASVFCISHSKLWFVKCYVGLMLLSPILNAAMDNISKRTYQWVIGLLTILNVYFGFLWQDAVFNSDGYTIANFVYIYMIGGYIRRYVDIEWCRKHRISCTSAYVGSSLLWGITMILVHYFPNFGDGLWLWGYNNPFTLIGAISFFLLFLSLPKFYNKTINWLATGTFAVYLVHSGGYSGGWFVTCAGRLSGLLSQECGLVCTIISLAFFSLSLELIICALDKLRSTITLPIINKVCTLYTHTHTHTSEDEP